MGSMLSTLCFESFPEAMIFQWCCMIGACALRPSLTIGGLQSCSLHAYIIHNRFSCYIYRSKGTCDFLMR